MNGRGTEGGLLAVPLLSGIGTALLRLLIACLVSASPLVPEPTGPSRRMPDIVSYCPVIIVSLQASPLLEQSGENAVQVSVLMSR